MEYLTTYGWAILIIAIVMAALFSLGVFNPYTFSPKASPGSCQVVKSGGYTALIGTCTGQIPQSVASFNGASSWIGNSNIAPLNQKPYYTISFWVYPKNSHIIYAEGIPDGTYTISIFSNGSINVGAWNAHFANNWLYTSSSSSAVKYNTWNFVTINLSKGGAGSGTLSFYVNGNLMSTSSSQEENNSGSHFLDIGNNPGYTFNGGQSTSPFFGYIANLQIYNTSLSSADIQALYKEGIGGAPININNLVGWWPLNGNGKDYSGNGNDGTPTNVIFTSNWYNGYTAP